MSIISSLVKSLLASTGRPAKDGNADDNVDPIPEGKSNGSCSSLRDPLSKGAPNNDRLPSNTEPMVEAVPTDFNTPLGTVVDDFAPIFLPKLLAVFDINFVKAASTSFPICLSKS